MGDVGRVSRFHKNAADAKRKTFDPAPIKKKKEIGTIEALVLASVQTHRIQNMRLLYFLDSQDNNIFKKLPQFNR